ncbi:uncharacterized protein DSM5745_07115 [Aspergillus mulundensis]|uniref:NACHT domain-containing protein n=1 Tax=Aspergillus mulundensis TaxID=1810919 RepID=A0A3D8RK84_9EURO|nr:hypothetical protein DSM5745_07115 [Aspergillus mulundensis]RDW74453.1 hypothetical protein DSM5745_07115 [Aspergillus mulundensis]
MSSYHLRYEDFTVGWVTALPIELAAARKMLDEEYEYHDDSTYTLGRIGEHNVAIACFPSGQLGIANGATVAASLKAKFPALEFCLMVGIGGGVPSPENDIRLGDVVVSQPQGTYGGVVQYDLGKTVSGGRQMRTGFLNAPPAAILRTVSRLQSNHALGKENMSDYLSQFDGTQFDRQTAGSDVLFQSSYTHEGGPTCADCPQEFAVSRAPRTGTAVKIHYGTIASGNQVIKDATTRVRLSSELGGVLCFEMEAAGLMNNLPCLVIRGISDYSDSHKNASWQPFAAAVAAAYAREILVLHPASSGLQRRRTILDWIAPLEQEQRHAFVTSLRVKGTGGWLLEHPEYTKWRDNPASPHVLWCHGMGGAGKTVLFSNLIDVLRHRSAGPRKPVIFYYFDYEDQSRQTMSLFLRSLLRQLLDHIPNIPRKLVDAYTVGSLLSVTALEQIISEIIQTLPRLYILIDALDECVDPCLRKTIARFLENAARTSSVRLLLTSRPHVQEIPVVFPCCLEIPVRGSEKDIKAYISHEISQAGNIDVVDARFAEEITNTILRQADGMTEIIRLSHYAVNEYLIKNGPELFGDAEASISALCLTYLLLEPFVQGPRKKSARIRALIYSQPFISYAAKHWGDHVRMCESNPMVWNLTFRFLNNQQAAACAHQILQFNRGYRKIYWTAAESNSVNALHIATNFGLERVVDHLLSRRAFNINAATTIGTTALIIAASNGHGRITRALLRKGANPRLENWYGNALHCAAEDGHSNTIRLLVLSGMSPNVPKESGRYPIECTLDGDHADAFETLLNLGAKIKERTGDMPLLIKAITAECVDIVDVMLKRGLVDVNQELYDGTTSVHVAAGLDNTAILDNLIKHGARIDVLDNEWLSPLDHALARGSDKAAKLLRSYGAKRNID